MAPYAYISNSGSNNVSNLNKYDEAIKAFEKAIEVNPNDLDAWYNKGVALGKLCKFDEAIKAYDKAIEINPNDSDVWYNKGLALDSLNKFILPSNAI
jgi:tetratricopeptide (TPR) repeat protein